jgi:hypothetical protein
VKEKSRKLPAAWLHVFLRARKIVPGCGFDLVGGGSVCFGVLFVAGELGEGVKKCCKRKCAMVFLPFHWGSDALLLGMVNFPMQWFSSIDLKSLPLPFFPSPASFRKILSPLTTF